MFKPKGTAYKKKALVVSPQFLIIKKIIEYIGSYKDIL